MVEPGRFDRIIQKHGQSTRRSLADTSTFSSSPIPLNVMLSRNPKKAPPLLPSPIKKQQEGLEWEGPGVQGTLAHVHAKLARHVKQLSFGGAQAHGLRIVGRDACCLCLTPVRVSSFGWFSWSRHRRGRGSPSPSNNNTSVLPPLIVITSGTRQGKVVGVSKVVAPSSSERA